MATFSSIFVGVCYCFGCPHTGRLQFIEVLVRSRKVQIENAVEIEIACTNTQYPRNPLSRCNALLSKGAGLAAI